MPDQMLIVCRQASDPHIAGNVTGFFCRACGKELQVSPTARRQICELGGAPYCNPCGFTLAQKHAALDGVGAVVLSEQAQQVLHETGHFEKLVAGRLVETVTPEEFIGATKRRQARERAQSN